MILKLHEQEINRMVLGHLNKTWKSNSVHVLTLVFKVSTIWQTVVDAMHLGHKDNILQKENKLLRCVNSKCVVLSLQLGGSKVIF